MRMWASLGGHYSASHIILPKINIFASAICWVKMNQAHPDIAGGWQNLCAQPFELSIGLHCAFRSSPYRFT